MILVNTGDRWNMIDNFEKQAINLKRARVPTGKIRPLRSKQTK
jgi:hypothetical protein